MDFMWAHLLDSEIEVKKASASLAVIPGRLTKSLQPLDLTFNRSIKRHVRKQLETWRANENHSFTKNGNLKKASYEVAQWVSQVWKEISPEAIKLFFSQSEIISRISNEKKCDILADENNDVELDKEFLILLYSHSECSEF